MAARSAGTIGLFTAILVMSAPPLLRSQDVAPADLYGVRVRADAARAAGDDATALVLYRQVARQQPDSAGVWTRIFRLASSTGDTDTVIEAGAELDRLGHQLGPRFAYTMAQTYARRGDVLPAIDWLSRALRDRYDDRPGIWDDEAFAALRVDPRFRDLAGRPPDGLDREAGWRFDILYFRDEARRLHADPRRPAFAEPFQSAIERLLAEVPSLSDQQILYRLMQISAMLGDGHTGLYGTAGPPPHATISLDGRTLPVMFNSFSDGLFVVAGQGPGRELVGARVVQFGPVSTAEVFRRLAAYRGSDNAVTLRWLGSRFFVREAALLEAIGATDSANAVTLTLEWPGGARTRVALPSGDFDFPRKLRPPSAGDAPLYLQRVDTPYWAVPLPDSHAVYFQFNQVRDAETGPSIAEFALTLDGLLESSDATRLVMDLRHNNGGNNGLLAPLLRVVGGFAVQPSHHVYVITGQNTFSAAQNLLTRVEQLTGAVVVGEPSASSPNFVGEETTVVLPWSGLAGSISSLYWQDSGPNDSRQWIAPDIPVPTTAVDYFAGRDPVLETLHVIFDEGL